MKIHTHCAAKSYLPSIRTVKIPLTRHDDINYFFNIRRDLFNAAFVSCWSELSETQQDELIQSLEQALTSQDIPEITQALLNLAEFMEHCDKVKLYTNQFYLIKAVSSFK